MPMTLRSSLKIDRDLAEARRNLASAETATLIPLERDSVEDAYARLRVTQDKLGTAWFEVERALTAYNRRAARAQQEIERYTALLWAQRGGER